MTGGVEFLGRLEHGFRAEGGPGVVAGEQGLEFADDLLCRSFRDQVAFDFNSNDCLKNVASLARSLSCQENIPGAFASSSGRKN